MIRACLGAAFLLAGAVTFVLSLIGVFRFKFVLNRMHASAVADTLGTLLTSIGLIIIRGLSFASVKLVLIVAVLWITGPVCTNRIAAAELDSSDDYKMFCKEEK